MPSSTEAGDRRGRPFLRLLARACFVGAVAALAGLLLQRRAPAPPAAIVAPAPLPPLRIDWSREPFRTWKSPEDGLTIAHPARFEAVRGFDRFTSRDVHGGITETDVVAFRSMSPRAVICVASYLASGPLSWEEWRRRASSPDGRSEPDGPAPFAAEFGLSARTVRSITLGPRRALLVEAHTAVRFPGLTPGGYELWQVRSVLVADGARALRASASAHRDHYLEALPGLDRSLRSLRWSPPSR